MKTLYSLLNFSVNINCFQKLSPSLKTKSITTYMLFKLLATILCNLERMYLNMCLKAKYREKL